MQRFLEVYGMPLRLGQYPAGIGKTERDQLLRAVRNIGNDGAGIVPSTMTIDFVTQTSTGNVTDFLNAIQYWERKQSMAILGGTLTSQADGKTSTNALGAIHDKVRREIMLHDVRQIDPTINRDIVRPIALLNGMFAEDRMPEARHDTSDEVDQKAMVEVLDLAASMGMEIDVDWAHKALQIPKAGNDAKILTVSGKSPVPTQAGAALTRLAALAAENKTDIAGLQFALEAAADSLPLQAMSEAWFADLVKQIRTGADDMTVLEALSEQWPDADESALQARLTQVLFITEVLGRLENAKEQG